MSTPLLPLPRMLPTRFSEPWRFFRLPSERISTRDEAAGRTERTVQRPSADVVCVEVSGEVKEGRGVLPEFESEPSPPLGLPPRKPKALPFCARSERVDAAATCAQDVACARSGRQTGEKQDAPTPLELPCGTGAALTTARVAARRARAKRMVDVGGGVAGEDGGRMDGRAVRRGKEVACGVRDR